MNKSQLPTLYWTRLSSGYWNMFIAATAEGICYVGSRDRPFEELEEWANSRFPASRLIRDDEGLQPYCLELAQYLQGERTTFTIPFDIRGTGFQLAVWEALRAIPYGNTRSYSDIAEQIGRPAAVRAVGAAIGANPVLITIPCHRVVGKSGALTGYRGGMEMKERLLQLERAGLPAMGQ